ncbi:PspC domain-containing protein [Porticoccus sp. W117]|uniref:PspC domain-containing protein n=1 Tax=Porticoccus sp. W117 TaxID=3054777 RepID=UPI0025916723|nr:PspC domain-containing protein [Porticoccus sp. W117]MDM3870758.1 PspC domain-containing protein [Porticoccus sp. W117]
MSGQHHNDWQRNKRKFNNSRESGWNRDLYRNKREGVIAGVCAGLADYFGCATWVMRVGFVLGFFMLSGTAVFIYLLAWLVMGKRPKEAYESLEARNTARESQKKSASKSRKSADGKVSSIRLRRAQERLKRAISRVEGMEAYVTSRQYELNREFAKMDS